MVSRAKQELERAAAVEVAKIVAAAAVEIDKLAVAAETARGVVVHNQETAANRVSHAATSAATSAAACSNSRLIQCDDLFKEIKGLLKTIKDAIMGDLDDLDGKPGINRRLHPYLQTQSVRRAILGPCV